MKCLKTVLVMLFSFVLISSQTVFDLHAATDGGILQGQACTCCACAQTDCCLKQAPDVPAEPLAPVPFGNPFQTQQFVAAISTLLLQQPLATCERAVGSFHSSPSAPAVPLFKQNCTFLI